MDVDHPVAPGIDEPICHQPHEAGQADQLNIVRLEMTLKFGFEILTGVVSFVVEADCRNAFACCHLQTWGVRTVRQNQGDGGRVFRVLGGFYERSHIAAAPGDQHGGSFAGAQRHSICPL